LSPRGAVLLASLFNFVGAFVSTAVASAVGQGIIDTGAITNRLLLAALLGALAWNVATWWLGLPSSSSHALIGGLVGAALVADGASAVNWDGLVHSVLVPAVVAPLLGFGLAFLLMALVFVAFQRARPASVS